MANEKNWLQYYKNSLFDSENLAIDIAKIKNLFHQNSSDLSNALINSKQVNELLDVEERRINRLRGVTKKDNPKWHQVEETKILIAPFHLTYQTENPKYKNRTIHPFWITVVANRSGQLSAPKEIFPLIVRNYLTPMADVKNDFIFSSIDTILDAKNIEEPEPEYEDEPVAWDEYWDYINEVFLDVTNHNLYSYKTEGYNTVHQLTYFAVSSKIATAKSILFLYENLLKDEEELPALSKIISPYVRERRQAITDKEFLSYNHLHLGQMSNEFPLSISQRKTLLSYLVAEENAVTAVNGPPGTGKTTLLQSLVATEFVKAAIRGEDAPVIVACSNNNQAVTNIIDSFINSKSTMEGLSERWIPDFNGYATYLPSNSKSEKTLKGINFLKGNLFKHEGTLCNLENEDYIQEAAYYFLTNYCNYFDVSSNSLEDACNHLQDEIIAIEDILIDGVEFSENYINSIESINSILLNESDFIDKDDFKIGKIQEWRTIITNLKNASKDMDFKTKVQQYFSIGSSSNTEDCIFKMDEFTFNNQNRTVSFLKESINNFNLILQSHLKLKNWKYENNIQGFPSTNETLMWDNEYEKLNSTDKSNRFYYDELDVNLRHKAFLLATHYWEARWLLETQDAIENDTERGTGELAIQAKWKRRAMLTPCFVATFYMAPTHFLFSQFQGENEYGKPVFEYLPLYNFLDLLIIDEAGQVTPEVSIPMFSLAKKAFVVGDLKQIEPIWSIPERIDVGNLTSLNMLENKNDTNYLSDIGFLASSGSIMRMAQNACEYETPLKEEKEQGLVLLEHRRCNDEIIDFCNELAYNGILKPMKGKTKDTQAFPPMVAYHVEGVSERKYNSRRNIKEVNAIITWLQQNKETIQKAYGVDTIEKQLGIITPFASQKGELSKALSEAGYKVNDIKLGTVHALQGAERNIILFSSVYSNEDEGTMFFEKDNKPNMLNVAVSRAKESFILFGDTRIFDETKNTPSGVLKKHLHVHEMVS
ncbi:MULTISPECIES: DEAD/DEAH box helicase [unclassified Tenacibaculum]|uniref:DEAD/DEAH box helicase n=1 Tax=unclassified Tenacibaculum TaxID=2635139 RepID=UPI001F3783CC|nr:MULTISPECIES: DEAD/DEAH box helicase [unclassified Tenacibaculum]MCF2874991.1 DEAD/DEAH box helicase [Tenacibaculum sp. Cn5-1]MCF2935067.1 DEAD/DEAH box helicase [Tenacibaculum sp. Cn5-34]MCG7511491.1 DEAD/DEAH box helicase [Tenacibaculum sp. Cn5-46]